MAPKTKKNHMGKNKPVLKANKKNKAKNKRSKDGKHKISTKLGDMLKAADKKMRQKMKSEGAKLDEKFKKKGIEMRQKMKAKGNELRKKMKEKVHQKSEKMREKVKEKGLKVKKNMKQMSHELKAKIKEGSQDMNSKIKAKGKDVRTKIKENKKMMKQSGEELEKEMAGLTGQAVTGMRNKLVEWRKVFEEKGWAVGKLQDDWFTVVLLGLNVFSAAMAIPVLCVTIMMASEFKTECLAFLLTPAVSIGFLFSFSLLMISLAGFAGVWWNRLSIIRIHFFLTAVLVFMLLCFTLFGFKVTYQGGGKKLPGIAFRQYHFTDYSKWLQKKLVGNGSRWLSVKSCVAKGRFCRNWNFGSAEELYSAKLSSMQSGCCTPPYPCGFAYEGKTSWRLPSKPDAEPDCSVWDTNELCFSCDSCKAGILQNVKSKWYKASIVNITIISALIVILYRTWFVMRMSGRWESVVKEVKQAVRPKEKQEEKVEPAAVIDIVLEGHQHSDDAMTALADDEEDLLIPPWLEEETATESVKSSQSSSSSKRSKKSKKSKESRELNKVNRKETQSPQEWKATEEQLYTDEDDSWASPRQQADPVIGTFPQGFGAQNPLAAMSPWMQSPQAGYIQDGILYSDPSYMQVGYYEPVNYMQLYETDPHQGYEASQLQMFPQMQQMHIQDPQMQMYLHDPILQHMHMPDYQMPVQTYGLSQDPYMQSPNQGYQVPGYDPSQVYIDPNHAFQGWQNSSY